MLRALAAAGVPVPKVLAADDGLLLLEDLGADDGPGGAWADLGRVLRRLHDTPAAGWGWPVDHGFGAVPILNGAAPDWPAFWAERRLLPFCSSLPPDLAAALEALAARLPELLPKSPSPRLLHGDLWAGNVMTRGARVTGLIDPACYGGAPEVDLAMLCLFADPTPAFWQAYGRRAPGYERRCAIYQLWPALVHLRLFGSGYRGLVARCLAAV